MKICEQKSPVIQYSDLSTLNIPPPTAVNKEWRYTGVCI